MGFFKRKEDCGSLAVPEATIVEQPLISASELEQMVYSTYQEKLALEQQLKTAEETIKRLEDQAAKLRAAETFSRQSESERKRKERQNDELERRNQSLEKQLEQAWATITARELKIKELAGIDSGRIDDYQRELIAKMKRFANSKSGNWSRQKVLGLLDTFLPENMGREKSETGGGE